MPPVFEGLIQRSGRVKIVKTAGILSKMIDNPQGLGV